MRWLTGLLLILTLASCEDQGATLERVAAAPRLAMVAEDVTVQIRVDTSQFATSADAVADELATLLGPPANLNALRPGGLVLIMSGRFDRMIAADGRMTYLMDWDVREPGGTQVTLFRVGIIPQDPGRTLSERDAEGLAWFVADRLTRDDAIRSIILTRRT